MTNPVLARFASEPCLVAPAMAERFTALANQLAAHPDFAQISREVASTNDGFWPDADSWMARYRPYIVRDGVLQIPVKGILLHNFPFNISDWATGYEYIVRAFERGCEDFAAGNIKGIAFLSDSPGGMVAGCFDAVDRMYALKAECGVPVRAFAHEMAYSAAYAIVGGVADHIAMSRTGGVGSTGVVTMHLDVSAAMEKAGLKVTFIASDPTKVEGNAYEPLGDDAKARIQGRIDESYAVFVATIVRGRGISEAALRTELKAQCFTASQATSNGLADSIGSLDDATAAFAAHLDDLSDNTGDDEMAEQASTSAVDQAAHDAAVAAAREEGRTAGLAEGATAEQTRIAAILDSDEAKDRGSLASHLAFKTRTSAEDAIAMLAAAPKAVAATGKQGAAAPFADAMAEGNPEVGAGEGDDDDAAGGSTTDAASIRALAASVGLKGFEQKK